MKLVLCDMQHNIYLTRKYFEPLVDYSQDRGTPITVVGSLEGLKNVGILAHAEDLTPEVITRLKNDGNKIFSFDINDNTHLCYTYVNTPEAHDLDLIFKVSGLQTTQFSDDIYIDKNLNYSIRSQPFDADVNWKGYDSLIKSGKVMSLPYAPWNELDLSMPPWEDRVKHCLIRGSNHYFRFHLYLNLLKRNMVDALSHFFTDPYFNPAMADRFRYCPDCIAAREMYGELSYSFYKEHDWKNCNNSVDWGKDEVPDDFFITSTGAWNNRCVPMFYWLAEQFEKTHGEVNKDLLQIALNATFLPLDLYTEILHSYILYGDFKWMFSIYAPPRFWEAVNVRVINFVPEFTRDQYYFPEMKEGEHYLTYKVDFSNLEDLQNVNKEQYEYITNNCMKLFQTWIKGDGYVTSTNLLNYILEGIENEIL